jgi:hypothetical protein
LHLQIGFVSVCLDPAQVKQVASVTREAVEKIEADEPFGTRWKGLVQ